MTELPHRAVMGIWYDEICKGFGVVPHTWKVLNKCFYQNEYPHGLGPSFGSFFLSP